ncbi:MAG: ATP-binding cassette domain-containing protein [Actinomycetota bacterium]|nr:MAG: ATP-binding cassette domain-containing protein [Actinomycetota bacterium]
MLAFDDVVKQYAGGTVAVDHLSLVAPTGRITVLVGPSGCGKTTSLRMINRMITPTSGLITIDGVDIASTNAAQLRRGIGYVIQHAGLFPHRTVIDNVATVPRLLRWDRRRRRARALELLDRVGLSAEFADRYPAQLSGGQQQRVGVARALAADPPVMLMDEPFSAVDPVVREQLQEEFLRLQAELGKTIVFVTHDIDEAIRLGDQVAVLRVGGTLAQLSAPEQLLHDPVDDFVAGFVGRDRGYRALSFLPAVDLPLQAEPTVVLGADAADARRTAVDDWLLVVGPERGEPVGWVDVRRLTTVVDAALLHRGGTVARTDGSMRAALDAALSSPAGRGVIADPTGRFAGVVRPAAVLAALPDATAAGPTTPPAATAAGPTTPPAATAAGPNSRPT